MICSSRPNRLMKTRMVNTARVRAVMKLLTDAAAVGNATARSILFGTRDSAMYYYPDRQWKICFNGGYQYVYTERDAEKRFLDGANTYKINVPPNVPMNNFWSFMVYGSQTRSMLQTDYHFPGIDSKKEGLKKVQTVRSPCTLVRRLRRVRRTNECRPFRTRATT